MNRMRRLVQGQRGFSLVELMVAMTLSLLLLAGALSILYSSKITYNENDRLARLQESGRTVLELLLRDARTAGYLGCSRPWVGAGGLSGGAFTNVLNNSNSLLWNFAQPAFGYEATGASTWAPAMDALLPSPLSGSDALVLRTTRQGQPVFRLNAPLVTTTSVLQVDAASGATVTPNTPMVIADCKGAVVFMATGYDSLSATTGEIQHAASGGGDGNATNDLTREFDIEAQVMPIQTVAYYVRNGANGPSLWQVVGNGDPQELVEGVQNLQVRYGIDTDANFEADAYRTASAVNAANDWDRVVSIEVAVLVQSPQETGSERDGRTYDLLGTNFGPYNDRRQRTVFTTTVVLRNRTL